MLDTNGFDLWADGYDKAVGISDEENSYPFAGYKAVLGEIFRTVMQKKNAAVLDLGFGTGVLTEKLYENGCTVFGQDFSTRMIEIASGKMPSAQLYRGDLTKGLAQPLRGRRYDFIIATYSLHHLTDGQKIAFLHELIDCLNEDGKLLIGDVAFETRGEMEQCRQQAGEEWDDEERYFVAEELRQVFPDLTFTQISFCAGILTIGR